MPRPDAIRTSIRREDLQVPEIRRTDYKALALESAKSGGRDNLRLNWGRMQLANEAAYACISPAPVRRLEKKTVLESFEGFVDQIVGDIAFVTLNSEHGDTLIGQYPADKLAEKGIRERRRFKCDTVEVGGKVRVELAAIPDAVLSAAEEQAIRDEIEQLFGPDEPDRFNQAGSP
jgi:hypothetical protein